MIKSLLLKLAVALYKKYILPEILNNADKALNNMAERIVRSEMNPIDVNTINEIKQEARQTVEYIFNRFN